MLPATAMPEQEGGDWRDVLIAEFDTCADEINDRLAHTPLTDPSYARLDDQRQQYWDAVSTLEEELFDALLTKAPELTAALSDAATLAQRAARNIQRIGDAVGLAAALLVLAGAIASAVATGNAASVVSATKGVIAAAGRIVP